MRSISNCKKEQTIDSGEKRTMCVQTAEPYVEPQNNVDIEMTINNLKNR
jgi:hypothetical protein